MPLRRTANATRILDARFSPVGVSESQLIARCLAGDSAAEGELFRKHADRLFRLAFRLCGDSDQAADCTQETFIRAFGRLAQFRGESSLATWLSTILVSVTLNDLRRSRAIGRRTVELTDTIPAFARGEIPHDLRQRLYEAIDQLSPKLRAVFVLHEIEGYTHEEIGEILDIPAGTSKARLSDARARLRSALSQFAGDHTA